MRYLAAVSAIFFLVCTVDAQQQLLILQRNWSDMPTFYRDCMEVTVDGSYRFDHVGVSPGEPQRQQVHIGKLSDSEVQQLTGMLADPALEALTTPSLGAGSRTEGTDIDTFWIAIARPARPQVLFFDSTSSSGRKYSSGPRLPSAYQTPAIKALLNWYKVMSKRKNDIEKNARPSCIFQVRYESGTPSTNP